MFQDLGELFNTEKEEEEAPAVPEEDIGTPNVVQSEWEISDKAISTMVVDEEVQEELAREVRSRNKDL